MPEHVRPGVVAGPVIEVPPQDGEEALHRGVGAAVALAAHRSGQTIPPQSLAIAMCCELLATVRVMCQARCSTAQGGCHVQGRRAPVHGGLPSHSRPRGGWRDRAPRRDGGQVSQPDLVWCRRLEASVKQVGATGTSCALSVVWRERRCLRAASPVSRISRATSLRFTRRPRVRAGWHAPSVCRSGHGWPQGWHGPRPLDRGRQRRGAFTAPLAPPWSPVRLTSSTSHMSWLGRSAT